MLSNRLKTVASFITPYKKIADIGCDHGYLIQYAFENLNIESAQAIDNKPGPLESAKKNNIKFKKRIIFSLSSGLDDLNEEIEVIIMAGMGGTLISNLLAFGSTLKVYFPASLAISLFSVITGAFKISKYLVSFII